MINAPSIRIGHVSTIRLSKWREKMQQAIMLRTMGQLSDGNFCLALKECGFKSDALKIEMMEIDRAILEETNAAPRRP